VLPSKRLVPFLSFFSSETFFFFGFFFGVIFWPFFGSLRSPKRPGGGATKSLTPLVALFIFLFCTRLFFLILGYVGC